MWEMLVAYNTEYKCSLACSIHKIDPRMKTKPKLSFISTFPVSLVDDNICTPELINPLTTKPTNEWLQSGPVSLHASRRTLKAFACSRLICGKAALPADHSLVSARQRRLETEWRQCQPTQCGGLHWHSTAVPLCQAREQSVVASRL